MRPWLLVAGLLLASCTTTDPRPAAVPAPTGDETTPTAPSDAGAVAAPAGTPRSFPPAPAVPDGPLDTDVAAALEEIAQGMSSFVSTETVQTVGSSGDARVLWPLADVLRFTQGRPEGQAIADVANDLAGIELDEEAGSPWTQLTDHLIAWDLPAPPGYVPFKTEVLTQLEPRWEPFLTDPDAEVDWRMVGWGGVLADTRALGDTGPCEVSCIPALDDPGVTDAAGGDWYDDDRLVFAVEVGGEARAYPRHIMETHELVNDTIGGVRLGIPYCTLCGSAQAYVTEGVAGTDRPLVLRTSGLLHRSNKMMFDLDTDSLVDTFTGVALTGPLRERGVELEQVSVVTTTWGQWRSSHPDTTIVAEDGGIGREYELDPLGDRDVGDGDAQGPIFPVGDIDPRLPAREPVVGVVADGTAVAFPAAAARAALAAGDQVTASGVVLHDDGGGLRARLADGSEAVAHEAFWFAWSQFHPDTELWQP